MQEMWCGVEGPAESLEGRETQDLESRYTVIILIGLVTFGLLGNIWFYEYRVIKGPGTPKTLDLTGVKRL